MSDATAGMNHYLFRRAVCGFARSVGPITGTYHGYTLPQFLSESKIETQHIMYTSDDEGHIMLDLLDAAPVPALIVTMNRGHIAIRALEVEPSWLAAQMILLFEMILTLDP